MQVAVCFRIVAAVVRRVAITLLGSGGVIGWMVYALQCGVRMGDADGFEREREIDSGFGAG